MIADDATEGDETTPKPLESRRLSDRSSRTIAAGADRLSPLMTQSGPRWISTAV